MPLSHKNRTLWILLAAALVIAAYVWTSYNSFVSAELGVQGAWSQVEAQYQRRVDLIPNLMRTVQGASNFEQSTLQAVTAARTGWQNAQGRQQQIAAAQGFDSALSRLLVTVEAYPQLQATQAYRDLMTQLEGTENRITVARNDYNAVVQNYNALVKRFPKNMLAGMFGFEAEAFFQSAEGAETAPVVDFNASAPSAL